MLKALPNGKKVNIPDDEIKVAIRNLDISKDEAIEMWLDDNGYTINEEQEALTQKAVKSGVQRDMASVHGGKVGVKKKVNRPPDVDKIDLIKGIADYLETAGYDNVHIINISKLIGFDLGEDSYEIDLKRKRKPKNK